MYVAENGDEDTRKYYLCCKNEAQRDKWIQALSALYQGREFKRELSSLREGYLQKLSANGSQFNRRYFILHADRMVYYRKRDDLKESDTIALPPGAEINEEDGSTEDGSELPKLLRGAQHVFSVASSGDAQGVRRFYLQARDAADRDKWLEVLHNSQASKEQRTNLNSIKEGYLWMSNALEDRGKKVFCVLLQDQIYWNRKRLDSTPAGSIGLPSGFVYSASSSPIPGKPLRANSLFAMTNGDEGTTPVFFTAASASSLNEWTEAFQRAYTSKDHTRIPGSIQEGYLSKARSLKGSYQRRYFVLTQLCLQYFRRRADENSADDLMLTGVSSVEKQMNGNMPVLHVIEHGDKDPKEIFLAAGSNEELDMWERLIRDLIETKVTKKLSNSIKEGYLFKQMKMRGWEKRYCAVLPNQLLYYKMRTDAEPAGAVPISSATQLEMMSVQDQHGFRLKFAGQSKSYPFLAKSAAECQDWANVLRGLISGADSGAVPQQQQYTATAASNSPAAIGAPPPPAPAAPSPWQKLVDPASGAPYWWNQQTNVTTWDDPNPPPPVVVAPPVVAPPVRFFFFSISLVSRLTFPFAPLPSPIAGSNRTPCVSNGPNPNHRCSCCRTIRTPNRLSQFVLLCTDFCLALHRLPQSLLLWLHLCHLRSHRSWHQQWSVTCPLLLTI